MRTLGYVQIPKLILRKERVASSGGHVTKVIKVIGEEREDSLILWRITRRQLWRPTSRIRPSVEEQGKRKTE